MKRRPQRSWSRAVQWTCLIVGLSLLLVAGGAWIHRAIAYPDDLQKFKKAQLARASRGVAAEVLPPDRVIDQSLWSEGRVTGYDDSLDHELDVPMALLRIPALDLEVPIWSGTDEVTLNRGLGHIPGTAIPGETGNVAIAGHRDGFFRGLKDLEVGARLELETLTERVEFQVEELVIVDPQDVWVLDATPEPALTLVTCYPFYYVGKAPQRFIVRATGVSSRSYEQSEVGPPGANDPSAPE